MGGGGHTLPAPLPPSFAWSEIQACFGGSCLAEENVRGMLRKEFLEGKTKNLKIKIKPKEFSPACCKQKSLAPYSFHNLLVCKYFARQRGQLAATWEQAKDCALANQGSSTQNFYFHLTHCCGMEAAQEHCEPMTFTMLSKRMTFDRIAGAHVSLS